jgi:DNA repair exonuclease SbcCD ATPase subunit
MNARGYDPNAFHDDRNGTPTAESGDAGNVDKIRDILFGTQMREYDRRFATVEDRLLREAAVLRDDISGRLTTSEQYLRAELDALGAKLGAEERARLQGAREAMDALSATNHELSERVAALAEQTAQQQRELRAQMQEQHRVLGEELQRRHQEVVEALRREAYELRDAKADRTALAAMFTELAQRLSGAPDTR